jgi:Rrf2 family transcriptional regulator, nitric oxide-sensitive transcriptional repressor
MLSRTAEYALKAIVCLARDGGQKGLSTEIIAKTTDVPPSYLVKVLGLLARSGIVQSQRGLYGGYTLATNPAELTFLDVINAVDPLHRVQHCPIHPDGPVDQLCPLHSAIDRAVAAVEKEFASVLVSGLVKTSTEREPICGCGDHRKGSEGRGRTKGKPRRNMQRQK